MAYNTDARWNIGTITHMNDQRFKFCGFWKIPEILDTLFQFWALLQKPKEYGEDIILTDLFMDFVSAILHFFLWVRYMINLALW